MNVRELIEWLDFNADQGGEIWIRTPSGIEGEFTLEMLIIDDNGDLIIDAMD